jgi:Protein of unknown function (DUF1353)
MTTTIRFESTAPLAVSQVVDEPYSWATIAELVFHGSTRTVSVPIGSRTDWASVPGVLAWLIDPRIGAAAALMHDYCYRVLIPAGEMTYQEADQLLSEALWALNVPHVSRLLVWDAVRIASVASRPGGRIGMQRDLPMMAAIAVPGVMMAAASVVLLAPMGALKSLNWLAGRSNRVLRVLARLDVMGRQLPAWQSRSTNQPTTLASQRRNTSSR